MRGRILAIAPIVGFLTALVGCPDPGIAPGGSSRTTSPRSQAGTGEGEENVAGASSSPGPQGTGSSGGLDGGIQVEGTPTPTGSAPAESQAGTAPDLLPQATAKPQIGVTAVVLTGPSALTLYPEPLDPARSLKLPTWAQLTAHALRADDQIGGVRWIDRSGGHLTVSSGGLVAVGATASPGVHIVRAEARDDPSVFVDVPVQVLSTGEIEAVVR